MSTTTNGGEVSVSTANSYINRFISDYFAAGKAPVKSMIMNADLLRDYLADEDIVDVKFMLGARDVDHDGISIEVFTLVVAGYDSSGNYIPLPSGNFLDHTTPCPFDCPTVGNAANDNITV